MLSIIIPTLNAKSIIALALRSVAAFPAEKEIIVVDGGSTDLTSALAARLGAMVVGAQRGRGVQLAAGARAAKGEWLLFVHADAVLDKDCAAAAVDFMNDPKNRRQAAVFRLKLDDPALAARRVERLAAWRARALGLPYGDQALLIASDFYAELGGFKAMPLMEDVDFVLRIGKSRLVMLDACAVTSAIRYRNEGYILRPLRNLLCLGLYFLGVPLAWIARIYG